MTSSMANASSIQDLADKIPILRSDDTFKQYVDESTSVRGLKLDPDMLKENPEALANLTKNNENYLNKLTYQFLETESKQIFLGFLNEGHKLTAEEMDSTNQMIAESKQRYEEMEANIARLRTEIHVGSRKVLKSLAEVNRLNKSINELNNTNDNLQQEVNDLEMNSTIKVGSRQYHSYEQLEQLESQILEESTQLQEELEQLKLFKESRSEHLRQLESDLQSTEASIKSNKAILSQSVEKRQQAEVDPNLDRDYKHTLQLIEIWKSLASD
ncbi:hypothetical protein KL930_001394 [Ogataea haglerorum]|uniref:Uncharacterized protein n=1 Tax=Ogataea haglerorum TaxID=1937702 RepID=A0AAN6D4R2_9ASCO|nr:hypothetical protein KL915_003304 [Ogataea haglerorum]KAG7698616.1 hypothetical protein KL951_001880 [Ogataea haglerorum]KAG7706395.1 hypothetical protein KL914_003290 [Ogataea haglerorum]KAG7707891.1 hypothetical protein KL950_002517 [Ogataea haglerorum]KAG7717311.1 hypothetical protein KL913_003062 [Ogataea haglerorum]